MDRRDTRTRWQGVFARHRRGCAVEGLPPTASLADVSRTCTCTPSYYAKAYDRAHKRYTTTAGVSPKVASVLMGHATPDRQPGAAQITLSRYTHLLPDSTETARTQLDAWLAAQVAAGGSQGGSGAH